jgi:hypothetical protein
MSSTSSTYRRGAEALARGSWLDAREAFEAALCEEETAAALEGLGLAAWWLDLADVVFESRERAYRLFLDAGDRPSAARLAVWLAWDCWAFRGESAVANGWLQRARRLLDGLPDCVERAWLECREGALALFEEGDPDRLRSRCRGIPYHESTAARISKCWAAPSAVWRWSSGAVARNAALDEVNAAVVSGEMKDLVAIGLSCCYMIAACDRVRDYDRAFQWARGSRYFARSGDCVHSLPFAAICVHLHVARRMASRAGTARRDGRARQAAPR